MIKNLNQLKRALRPGMRLEVIGHCRPGCIGQLREVTWVNTQGFYKFFCSIDQCLLIYILYCGKAVVFNKIKAGLPESGGHCATWRPSARSMHPHGRAEPGKVPQYP